MTGNDDAERALATGVYGGGGLFGIAFSLGITEALVDDGFDLGSMTALGTSAGSWTAAALALGLRFGDGFDEVAHRAPRLPNPRANRLRDIAADLYGADTRCPTVRVVAVSLPRLRRTVLMGDAHPIADLVAASSAVPGMLPPHRIDRTRYVDGGVRSMASLDLASPAGVLLAVLPMPSAMFGPAEGVVERRTRRELAVWERANPGGRSLVVRPTAEIASLARRVDHLFDPDRARRCHDHAYVQGVELRAEWKELIEDAKERRRT